MNKSFLMIAIGAFLALPAIVPFGQAILPFPPQYMAFWSRFSFIGFFVITMGIRQVYGSAKELAQAIKFTFAAMILQFANPLIPLLLPMQVIPGSVQTFLMILVMLAQFFSSVMIFYFLLRSEYIWSPSATTRLDLTLYSIVGGIFLIVGTLVVGSLVMRTFNFMGLIGIFRFLSIIYGVVTIGLMAKLHMARR